MKKKHIGFKALARKVAKEYKAEGVSPSIAEEWGIETAAKVYREQQKKRRKSGRK